MVHSNNRRLAAFHLHPSCRDAGWRTSLTGGQSCGWQNPSRDNEKLRVACLSCPGLAQGLAHEAELIFLVHVSPNPPGRIPGDHTAILARLKELIRKVKSQDDA